MKLPNQTKGPVTLSKIDYARNLSEETYAFTAVVTVGLQQSRVSNDGHGGCHRFDNRDVMAKVGAYALTVPPLKTDRDETFAYDADLLISEMISDAIQAREDARMAKKGYAWAYDLGGNSYYGRSTPPGATNVRNLAVPQ